MPVGTSSARDQASADSAQKNLERDAAQRRVFLGCEPVSLLDVVRQTHISLHFFRSAQLDGSTIGILHGMTLGLRARVFDADANNLGFATLPTPVDPGDVFALETGTPLRIVKVVLFRPGGEVDCAIEAEPARLPMWGEPEGGLAPPGNLGGYTRVAPNATTFPAEFPARKASSVAASWTSWPAS